MKKKKKSVSYAKWGYIFILPFFITYIIFSLIPLLDTNTRSLWNHEVTSFYKGFGVVAMDTVRKRTACGGDGPLWD